MSLANTPLRDLLANAEVLAESLEADRRPKAAALIRELVARVVPMKVVPSGGSNAKRFVPDDLPQHIVVRPGKWCGQCDRLVSDADAAKCQSRFCKVAA